MDKKPYKSAKTRAPDLDKYITPKNQHNFVNYGSVSWEYPISFLHSLILDPTVLFSLFIFSSFRLITRKKETYCCAPV